MAQVTDFIGKINDIVGDCGDNSAVETWIADGCNDVVNRVTTANPLLLEQFASESSNVTSATTDIDETVRKIHMVYRKRIGETIGSEILSTVNQGFESAIAKNSNASAVDGEWIDEANESDSNITITRDTGSNGRTVTAGSGKVLLTGASSGITALKETGLTVDKPYRFTVYSKVPGSSAAATLTASVGDTWNTADTTASALTLTTSYQKTYVDFVATSTTMYLQITLGDADTEYTYIDDLSLMEIDFIDAQINCRKVTPTIGKLMASNPRSIYHSNTKHDPVYYIHNELLNIYPAPTATDTANYTFVPRYTVTSPSASTTSIDGFPLSYYDHVVTYAAMMSAQRQMRDKSDSLPNDITLPVMPGSISLSTASESLPTFSLTLPSAPVAPASPSISAPNVGAITVTNSGSEPTYNKPVLTIPSLQSIGTLSLPVAPTSPSAPNITSPGVSTVTVGSLGTSPNYTKPTLDSGTDTLVEMEAGTIGTTETDFEGWFSIVSQYIQDEEDTDLAQATLGQISTYINAFQADLQNELNEFNKENAIYQSTVQKAIQDAQFAAQEAQKEADLTFQATIQDYTLELQKYSSDVSKYQAEVNSIVQKWQNEELEKKFREWTTEYSNRLNAYQADIQNETNRYQKDLSIYQAELQKGIKQAEINSQDALKEADLTMQATIQDYQQELALYQSKIQNYTAEVQALTQKETQEFSAGINKYTAEIQKISAANQDKLGKFQAESNNYNTELQAKVQAHNTKLEKASADYKWLQQQYDMLYRKYETMFATAGLSAMQPKGE